MKSEIITSALFTFIMFLMMLVIILFASCSKNVKTISDGKTEVTYKQPKTNEIIIDYTAVDNTINIERLKRYDTDKPITDVYLIDSEKYVVDIMLFERTIKQEIFIKQKNELTNKIYYIILGSILSAVIFIAVKIGLRFI